MSTRRATRCESTCTPWRQRCAPTPNISARTPSGGAVTGLVHDFDYERWPNAAHSATEEHPAAGVRVLREHGYPEDVLEAILGHASYSGVPRVTRMAKALFAVDELTGLITATALVRPSKSVHEVDARSVRKKMKDKAFARGVNRDDVMNGAADLGVDLDWHIQFVIDAMKARGRLARARGNAGGSLMWQVNASPLGAF